MKPGDQGEGDRNGSEIPKVLPSIAVAKTSSKKRAPLSLTFRAKMGSSDFLKHFLFIGNRFREKTVATAPLDSPGSLVRPLDLGNEAHETVHRVPEDEADKEGPVDSEAVIVEQPVANVDGDDERGRVFVPESPDWLATAKRSHTEEPPGIDEHNHGDDGHDAEEPEEPQEEQVLMVEKVPLICPVSQRRIVTAALTPRCKHLRCFDLETVSTLFPKKGRCPVCHRRFRTQNLIPEVWMQNILDQVDPAVTHINVSNGVWEAVPPATVETIDLTRDDSS